MARSARQRQALFRERQRKGLVPATAWLDPEAVEKAIDAGTITEASSEDRERLGELVALVFSAWAKKLSQRDT